MVDLSALNEKLTSFILSKVDVAALQFILNNMYLALCLGFVLLLLFILFILYFTLSYKTYKLQYRVRNYNTLGRVYTPTGVYDKVVYEKLTANAITVLKANVGIITQPYFYAQDIKGMLKQVPKYIEVMKYANYVVNHRDMPKDALTSYLMKTYGANYENSDKLITEIRVKKDNFTEISYNHSVIVDLDRSRLVYVANMSKVGDLLKAEAQV